MDAEIELDVDIDRHLGCFSGGGIPSQFRYL